MWGRFHELSRDSTAFYYLGFQGLVPWVRDVCWFQIQDSVVTAVVKKNGQTGFLKQVGYVTRGRDHTFRLEWQQAGIKCSLDGREVLSADELHIGLSSASAAGTIIPNRPLPLFLGAHSPDPAKTRPKLPINWLRIHYRRVQPPSKR